MLSRLHVKNVALISEADIEFDSGLNVLSGETGSGKSVILDSINFILGCKADRTMIRYGENEALVKAEFIVDSDSLACKLLNEMDIECDGSIIISRKYNQDGKGSIKINGNTVTAAMLKKITAHLVDVHGQSEHFFLLDEDNQLKTIDGLCGESARALKTEIAERISLKRQCKREIAQLGGDEQERARTLDLLSYQINEIQSANLKVGELEQLQAKKKIIGNSERIISSLSAIKSILSEDSGCNDMLSHAVKQAGQISDLNETYSQIYTRLDELSIEAQDLSDSIDDLIDDVSFDGAEAQSVEERISIIKGLIKKYGADEEEVLIFAENAKNKYDLLVNAAESIEKLNNKIEKYDNEIYQLCTRLTSLRKERCATLGTAIENELKSLNIPNAKFGVQFNEYDRENVNLDSPDGADSIKFMFSANKGEPLKPLNKVVSGGEMSRFMLAIKSQLKDLNGISTYIFDEIDAGISGETARTVAEKFLSISKNTQIIAVSHLPQVCAAASEQLLIYKTETGEKTVTNVKTLTREQRIEEIVRLIGNTSSLAAKTHAEELLSRFNN